MTRHALAASLFVTVLLAAASAQAAPPAGYRLVWSDEFSGSGLPDGRKWVYDTEANATGWYNGELQYYAVKRLANTRRADGRLSIVARKEKLPAASDWGGQNYTSGRLITRGKASWTYGFFEVRARLACGQGSWPAFWLLPVKGSWPAAGEIDIMEKINNDPTIFATVHNTSTAGTYGDQGSRKVTTACTADHLYQLEWTKSRLRFAIDGRTVHTYDNAGTGTAQWPFDKPFYLIVNLAVGGKWPGKPDDAIFPVTMRLDYVRVYQK